MAELGEQPEVGPKVGQWLSERAVSTQFCDLLMQLLSGGEHEPVPLSSGEQTIWTNDGYITATSRVFSIVSETDEDRVKKRGGPMAICGSGSVRSGPGSQKFGLPRTLNWT